jgi:hypothetical protein
LKITKHYLICALTISLFSNISGFYFLSDWVRLAVEEASQEFGLKAPKIYVEMRDVRAFNPMVTPICTDLRVAGDGLIIGDRLIEKLDAKELKLLTKRAFIYSKNWYFLKKVSLIAAILFSNVYFLENRKDAALQAAGIFLLDAIAYSGLNVYCEKQIDKEVIKDAHDQEILDAAYQKISPNGWPLNKWPLFYKNVGRYVGF